MFSPLLATIVAASPGVEPGLLAQAVEPDTTRIAARILLMNAPALQDSSSVVEETEFMEKVLALFTAIAKPTSDISSGLQAVGALEGLLTPDSVNIQLQSDPPGFPVQLSRISGGPESAVEVITDTTLRVPAGLYRLGFFNNATGEVRSQGRACLDDCLVRWRF